MSKNVNIVIVEDEAYNLRLLQETIKKLRPDWKVSGTLESVKSTVEWLKNNTHPDLLFLDIQLADGLSFSIFEQVDVKSMVIFTTAYDIYAIRAFKVNSIDYLLKPFKDSELEAAIKKFERFSNLAGPTFRTDDFHELLEAIRKGEKKYRKRFLISKGSGFIRLNPQFEGDLFISRLKAMSFRQWLGQ